MPEKNVQQNHQFINYPDGRFMESVIRTWVDKTALEKITIEPRLYKRDRKWVVILEEHWPFPEAPLRDSRFLDDRIEWAVDKLKSWPGCKRMAYDQFWFEKKIEADKFITLYTLTWR